MVALGFVVTRFGLFLTVISASQPPAATMHHSHCPSNVLGIALVILGIGSILGAVHNHPRVCAPSLSKTCHTYPSPGSRRCLLSWSSPSGFFWQLILSSHRSYADHTLEHHGRRSGPRPSLLTLRGEPTKMGPVTAVLFEDTCGNLMNLVEPEA